MYMYMYTYMYMYMQLSMDMLMACVSIISLLPQLIVCRCMDAHCLYNSCISSVADTVLHDVCRVSFFCSWMIVCVFFVAGFGVR